MNKKDVKTKIEKLEKKVEWLLQRGCNDEKLNDKLRILKKSII